MYCALWVQLALAVSYRPFNILIVVPRKTFSSHIDVTREINSTLNPFLYRWKIFEDKQQSRQSDKHFAVHEVNSSSSKHFINCFEADLKIYGCIKTTFISSVMWKLMTVTSVYELLLEDFISSWTKRIDRKCNHIFHGTALIMNITTHNICVHVWCKNKLDVVRYHFIILFPT